MDKHWLYIRRFYSTLGSWFSLWVWAEDLKPGDEIVLDLGFLR